MLRVMLIFFLLGVAYAQLEEGKAYSNGLLDYVEDSLNEEEKDPREKLPHVKVVDTDALEICLDEGFESENCEKHEYAVPGIPYTAAVAVEKAVVNAWYRFETRTRHRTNVETGHTPALVACTLGLGALDVRHFAYFDEVFFPADEFCDGKRGEIIPPCTLKCDLPTAECPEAPSGCADCVKERIQTAREHSMENYYPDYLEDIATALATYMPLALPWQSPLLVPGGSLIAPVWAVDAPFDDLIQLALDASDDDPRAVAYFFQAASDNNVCQALMPPPVMALLKSLPLESFDLGTPGIPKLEGWKRTLADREDAANTWKRFDYFWNGVDNIYPKYDSKGPSFLGTGGEDAVLTLGPPSLHACMGYATFLQVSQKVDVIVDVFPGYSRRAACLIDAPPYVGVTASPSVPEPFLFTGPRTHLGWNAVPEGYDIPGVEGKPLY